MTLTFTKQLFIDLFSLYVDLIDTSTKCVDVFYLFRHISPETRTKWGKIWGEWCKYYLKSGKKQKQRTSLMTDPLPTIVSALVNGR